MSSNWYFDKYYQYKDLEFKLTSLKIYEIYFQNNLIGTLLLNKAKNISTVSYKKKYKTKYDVNFKYVKMTRRLFDKLANAKALNSEIDKFIKEEYYEEKSFRDNK